MDVMRDAIIGFALSIGIDVENEPKLLLIAENALTKNLPPPWELGIVPQGEPDAGMAYFVNPTSDETTWTHPEIDEVIEAVQRRRVKLATKKSKTASPPKLKNIAAAADDNRQSNQRLGAPNPSVEIAQTTVREQMTYPRDPVEQVNVRRNSAGIHPLDNTKSFQLPKGSIDTKASLAQPIEVSEVSGFDEEDFEITDFRSVQRSERRTESVKLSVPNKSVFSPKKAVFTLVDKSMNEDVVPITQHNTAVSNISVEARRQEGRHLDGSGLMSAEVQARMNDKADSVHDTKSTVTKSELTSDWSSAGDQKDARPQNTSSGPRSEMYIDAARGETSSTKELEALRWKLQATEKDLQQTTSRAEEASSSLKLSYEKKLREASDSADEKLASALKKAKIELEELQDRYAAAEKKHSTEVDQLTADMTAEARKKTVIRQELEATLRKASLAKDQMLSDLTAEAESLRCQVAEREAAHLQQTKELRSVREEHASMASRLASALLISSVAAAEMEALRAAAAGSATEAQTCHSALVQATQRLSVLDGEAAALKAEGYLLRQEADSAQSELRKLRLATSSTDDRAQVVGNEIKRKNIQLQGEVQRLTSRVAELEAISSVQHAQLGGAQENELANVREVQRLLDRSEYEVQRLKNRLTEAESKRELDAGRIIRLEAAVNEAEATMSKKEISIKEERRKYEVLHETLRQTKDKASQEVSELKKLLEAERTKFATLMATHKQTVETMQEEAAQNMPKLVASMSASQEAEYERKLDTAVRRLRAQYEEKAEALRREGLEREAAGAEREAARRIAAADDKAELESLRILSRQLRSELAETGKHPLAASRAPFPSLIEDGLRMPSAAGLDQSMRSVAPSVAAPHYDRSLISTPLEQEVMEVLQLQLRQMRQQLNLHTPNIRSSFSHADASNVHYEQMPRREVPYRDYEQGGPRMRMAMRMDADDKFAQDLNRSTSRRGMESESFESKDLRRPVERQSTSDYYHAEEYVPSGQNLSFDMSMNNNEFSRGGRDQRRVKFAGDSNMDFSSISDGGYHEGYWRLKYQ